MTEPVGNVSVSAQEIEERCQDCFLASPYGRQQKRSKFYLNHYLCKKVFGERGRTWGKLKQKC